jgi:hypothetical protein
MTPLRWSVVGGRGENMQDKTLQPGEMHPEEWQRDLNPHPNAGTNYGDVGDELDAKTAHDYGELRQMLTGFSVEELKRILVVPHGARLEQGATYIDLATPDRNEFTARAGMEAGEGNWFIPKKEVDYQLWNRLIGVDNPERTGEADD